MLMGYNNDVGYRGLTVHVQTEDHGLRGMKITTQVFHSGAILGSYTESYAELIEGIDDPPDRDEVIRKKMRAMHKQAFRNIKDGVYDAKLTFDEAAPAAPSGELEVSTPERFKQAAAEEQAAQEADEDPIAAFAAKSAGGGAVRAPADEPIPFSMSSAYRGQAYDDKALIALIRAAVA